MSTAIPRILHVEDDPGDVRLTLAVFAELHLDDKVLAVNDAVQALDYLHGRGRFADRPPYNPAVLLLDLKLPRMSGLKLLEAMKTDEALRMIPVVVLSSSKESGDISKAYELGANAYVVKTIDYEQFAAALRALGQFWAVVNEPPPGSAPLPGQDVDLR